MSGIMAIVSLDGRPVPTNLARKQLAAIAHRGEWEPRLWEADGVALGHVICRARQKPTTKSSREAMPHAGIGLRGTGVSTTATNWPACSDSIVPRKRP